MARQARSLDVLLAEVNAAHGQRSKVSDGGLGDPAHASRVSDHNPNGAGVWRARDFTDDDVDDNHDGRDDDVFDCDQFAVALVAMYHAGVVHPAMRSGAYTIWKGRIYSYDRRHEGWRPYSGSNPHDKHLHQSVATAASGYDSTAPWGVMEDDDMATSKDEILDAIADQGKALDTRIQRNTMVLATLLRQAIAGDAKTADRIVAAIEAGDNTILDAIAAGDDKILGAIAAGD